MCREILEGLKLFGGFHLAQILAQIVWCADFSSTFWRLKNRYSGVTQKNAQMRKNLQRPDGLLGGVPYSIIPSPLS